MKRKIITATKWYQKNGGVGGDCVVGSTFETTGTILVPIKDIKTTCWQETGTNRCIPDAATEPVDSIPNPPPTDPPPTTDEIISIRKSTDGITWSEPKFYRKLDD